ncbi:alpha-amylase family glycosyl hydrolase [Carboxylicivirga linearis]|uniref:Alpha-amylase n=1 Tax=Carboxylicivirga linearis TaxID=1628157 RepID=A0ABS5JX24_9BACT|nr:alpha-amylase family glycosyl hydrolase [Carboxylicivirga linearis]MBS2099438.1 alpha-amylase [Carboxylicivirga linearis]
MKSRLLFILAFIATLISCATQPSKTDEEFKGKAVVYQVFTRLFGNTNETNKPWGTIQENGVGKFNDFTDKALSEIKDLGVTHIWYTGVPHHAVVTDYTQYGISLDDPDVVKGRAGSPYAVKDYYQVDPDMAIDPANRLQEFKALVQRTHQHGMKVIIDIVPNHVARHYEGLNNPNGVEDFGAADDTSVEYAVDNNFYYIPGKPFEVPEPLNGYQPLGGEENQMVDGKFDENPAKWTGNGSRKAQPHFYDWYETVKINYGVHPDGTHDFDSLPDGYELMSTEDHFQFWKGKEVPDSWVKFRDIALYWTDFGIDGFRFDMAEMVPVEFWSYMNSSIKHANPDAFLLAEVYNPGLYREYIHKGKMDYLYDKVELYDTLKHVMQGYGLTDNIPAIQTGLKDIEHHMLHFLENHDEQRIASPEFAGDAAKGKPAMVVSALISTSPTMIYFGQEVGEPGAEDAGFGDPSRTSIFDYIGVPHHQRWMNDGAFDGGRLSPAEKDLRDFYKRLLNFTTNSKALMGEYKEIHSYNRNRSNGYDSKVFSFARWSEDEHLIVVSNFDVQTKSFDLQIPSELIGEWDLPDSFYIMTDQLYGSESELEVTESKGIINVELDPLESLVLRIE